MKISIETYIEAPVEKVWTAWTTPEDITKWNFASDDWSCPKAIIDLRESGSFNYRMEAKDGSMGFDFTGTFSSVKNQESIEFVLEDDRVVSVIFSTENGGTRLVETFEAEDESSAEQQKTGWQCILNNLKAYVESK